MGHDAIASGRLQLHQDPLVGREPVGAALFRDNLASRLLSAALGVPTTNKLLRKLEEVSLAL